MEEKLEQLEPGFKFTKKKVISLGIVIFLLIGIAAGVYLVQIQHIFKSRASETQTTLPQSNKLSYVPGEVLVKFKSQINPRQKQGTLGTLDIEKRSVPYSYVDENSLPAVVKDVHSKYQIKMIDKTFKYNKPTRGELVKSLEVGHETELSKIFKISFDEKTPIDQVVKEFTKSQEVVFAEPNYIYTIATNASLSALIDGATSSAATTASASATQTTLSTYEVATISGDDPYFSDSYPNSVNNRDSSWNPPFDYQWNIKRTNSADNWKVDTSSIIVAVLDTGVDVGHSELGNVWVNPNEIPGDNQDNDNNGCWDDINGCNFAYGANGDVKDIDGHGTHVAGVISAKTHNAVGIAGVTNNTKIMAVKVLGDNGSGSTVNVVQGVRYSVDNGARILNMSLGGSKSRVLDEALSYAIANNVIPVVAAGNGNQYSPEEGPANYKPAIVVGGVDEEMNKMKYANYGPNIDVSAPGGSKDCMYQTKPGYCSNILSLKSSAMTGDLENIVNGQYLRMSGTSMATPHVAGVLAYLLTQHPDWTLVNIENYIRFNSIDPSSKGHTEKTGWGVINATGTNFVPPSNIDFVINYPAENSLIGRRFNIGGTIKADNFDHFEIAFRKAGESNWITSGVELINNGRSQVVGDYVNLGKAGTITLPETSSLGVYEIKITLYTTDGKSLSSTKSINYLQKPGTQWFYQGEDSQVPDYGELLIADLDGNGKKEIILYDYGDYDHKTLQVFDSNYNLLWKIDQGGQAVVGDIDKKTSSKEVILQTKNKIYVYDNKGQLITDYPAYSNLFTNLAISDLDNNGIDDLCFIDGTALKCLEQNQNFQLVEKWNFLGINPYYGHVFPIIGDVNGDQFKEIVIITNNKIGIINYQGKLIGSGAVRMDSMVLADMDSDGKEEILAHQQWGPTRMYKLIGANLEEKWSYNNSNNIDTIAIADFNNDHNPEVYLQVNNTSRETVLDKDGRIVYEGTADLYWPGRDRGGVVLVDKDNNKKIDVFHLGTRSGDHRGYLGIRELDYTSKQMDYVEGEWKTISPQWSSLGRYGYDIIGIPMELPMGAGDLDGNGRVDIVMAGLGIIEYSTQGTVYWPHRYHDYQRTGSYNFQPKDSPASPTPTPFVCTPCVADVGGRKNTQRQIIPDGWVNGADASFILGCYGKNSSDKGTNGQSCLSRDINKDGRVDLNDLNCIKSQFLKSCQR